MHQLDAGSPAFPVLQTDHGRLVRCRLCGGLHFQFGNLAARLDAESFLRLSNLIHQAAVHMTPDLAAEERVAIPMDQGLVSLVLDRAELAELHSLVRAGLQWLSEEEPSAAGTVQVH